MPCHTPPPTQAELDEFDAKKNLEQYGVNVTHVQMLRGIACAAMRRLEDLNLLEGMEGHALKWYVQHSEAEGYKAPTRDFRGLTREQSVVMCNEFTDTVLAMTAGLPVGVVLGMSLNAIRTACTFLPQAERSKVIERLRGDFADDLASMEDSPQPEPGSGSGLNA